MLRLGRTRGESVDFHIPPHAEEITLRISVEEFRQCGRAQEMPNGFAVGLGFEAPREVLILRSEVADRRRDVLSHQSEEAAGFIPPGACVIDDAI